MQTIADPTAIAGFSDSQQPLRIVVLGDSLVYGYGDPVGGGWVDRLRRLWMAREEAGHVLYNLGIRGDRVSLVSQRLEEEYRHRGELRNRLPDLIILSVGVNDSARMGRTDGKLMTDIKVFEHEVAQLLDKAQQLRPVLFVGMVPVNEDRMPFLDCCYFNHYDQYRFKEITKQACKTRKIPYLDLFDLWLSRGEDWIRRHLTSDGLHPNVAGYQVMLEDVIHWEPIAKLTFSSIRKFR